MPLSDYTIEEIQQMCSTSNSFSTLARRLQYKSTGAILYTIKRYLEKHQIDYSHFTFFNPAIHRTPNNVFVENSTAVQSTVRKFFKKGNYTPYQCAICGMPPIWNNRPLTLTLDHINGNNRDNRLTNLRWICPNCDRQLPTSNGCNKGTKQVSSLRSNATSSINKCIDCHQPISRGAQRCVSCYQKHIIKQNEERRQTRSEHPNIQRNELKMLLRQNNMTQIGIYYGMTANGIVRWCKKYNLPFRIRDIKKITDAEWETL